MECFNVHGFRFAVDDYVSRIFIREYGWTSVPLINETELNLRVLKYNGRKQLPTKPPGLYGGMLLPFGKKRKTLWFNKDIPPNVILSHTEGLFWWPDKTMIHSAGVTKNGNAYLFTGAGNVGKTSIVLRLLNDGFSYLGDDWLIVGNGMVYPLPKTIRVFDYNLKNSDISKAVLGKKRFLAKPFLEIMRLGRKYAPHRYLRYGFTVMRPIFNVHFTSLHPESKIANPTRITRIFFLERKNVTRITMDYNLSAVDLSERMASVSEFEWNFIRREYYRYKTDFGISDDHFENRISHDTQLFNNLFEQTEIIRVTIPRNADLSQLDIESILELD